MIQISLSLQEMGRGEYISSVLLVICDHSEEINYIKKVTCSFLAVDVDLLANLK